MNCCTCSVWLTSVMNCHSCVEWNYEMAFEGSHSRCDDFSWRHWFLIRRFVGVFRLFGFVTAPQLKYMSTFSFQNTFIIDSQPSTISNKIEMSFDTRRHEQLSNFEWLPYSLAEQITFGPIAIGEPTSWTQYSSYSSNNRKLFEQWTMRMGSLSCCEPALCERWKCRILPENCF